MPLYSDFKYSLKYIVAFHCYKTHQLEYTYYVYIVINTCNNKVKFS